MDNNCLPVSLQRIRTWKEPGQTVTPTSTNLLLAQMVNQEDKKSDTWLQNVCKLTMLSTQDMLMTFLLAGTASSSVHLQLTITSENTSSKLRAYLEEPNLQVATSMFPN